MFNLPKLLAVSCIILAGHAEEGPQCSPIPGDEQLWARSGLRFVLVGEMHGTAETPTIFADLVCSARQTKRNILVGVELGGQHDLDVFLDSGDHNAAVADLLSTNEWTHHDGRTSQAMLLLLENLRELKMQGLVSGIVALYSTARARESAAKGEERMALALTAAVERYPDALVLALTGNAHAFKKMLPEIASYPFMASFLPPAQTVSLLIRDLGGEAWNCNGTCGPHSLESSGGVERGITLASPHPGYDGVLSTGLRATASAPARP